MQRRDFLKSGVALPSAASPPRRLRQLTLHLDYRANVRITDDRLTISFDLWRAVALGIGGEASLELEGRRLPDDAAWRASA